MLELLDEIFRRTDAGESLALCTVVRTAGSTPQKRGALMLILRDGQTLGTIGGGCVEAEVKTRAVELLSRGESRVLRFKLDHDLGWDDGMVCGGVMDVAVETIDTPARAAALRDARQRLACGEEATIRVTAADAETGESVSFTRTIDPKPTLLIAGAGHVGAALAAMAPHIDFHVTVIDDRADLATPQRLGGARCIVGEIDAELERFSITPHTYVVIVTRGHRHDGRALAAVVNSPARYVGLIGSKRKIITIVQDLHRQGVARERLARIHAPIGFDISAITPGEIAVSIAAELIAVRRGVETTGSDRAEAHPAARPMRLTPDQLRRALGRDGA